jgi:signal transduction histidine kinase
MRRMVDDLLLLAREEQPDFLTLDVIDLDVFTLEVVEKFAGVSEHEWQVVAVGEGTLVGDRDRLTQAMVNLLDNAARYAPAGSVVEVGSCSSPLAAELWVTDHGPGIDHREQEQIFARLHRGTAARDQAGVGLGLTIVNAIVLAHGGWVEVDSEPMRGSTFRIVLPRTTIPGAPWLAS